jgi:FdhD protein
MSHPASATPVALLQVDSFGISARADAVATEEPLEIQLSYNRRGLRVVKSVSVTMRTPGHEAELAAGFLFTEGIITHAEQISAISPVHIDTANNGNTIRVELSDSVTVDLRSLERHFYTTSSCGVCGKTSLAALRTAARITLVPNAPVIEAALIRQLPAALRAAQTIFDHTGGLHAAALFNHAGRLLSIHEDVGRHNAVDKLIGAQFLARRTPLGGFVLFVSGRASFELMQKAVMAGIPVLAAVGAPSSLAVELAREFGATLLGFVRDGRFNIYSGAQRVRETCNAATNVEPFVTATA